jgi:CRP-like cAMP-binding protein
MTTTETEEMLSTTLDTDIFNGVNQSDVENILSHPEVKQISLNRGQYIYHHGDVSEKFWIILSGEIIAQVHSLRNPFHSVRYRPGDITGLKGIVNPGTPRPVSMVADSEVELIEIPGAVIMALDSAVWGAVMANIAKMLLDRLLVCHDQMDH